MGLDPSPSHTDGQCETEIGLALSPTRLVRRNLVPGTSSGMGLLPSLFHTGYWYSKGMGRPIPEKVLTSGMPKAPSPTHS
jgi:hypothetical protein